MQYDVDVARVVGRDVHARGPTDRRVARERPLEGALRYAFEQLPLGQLGVRAPAGREHGVNGRENALVESAHRMERAGDRQLPVRELDERLDPDVGAVQQLAGAS